MQCDPLFPSYEFKCFVLMDLWVCMAGLGAEEKMVGATGVG